jgi:hypothetical protein
MHTMDNGSGPRTQVKNVTIRNGSGSVSMKFLDPKGKVLAKHSHELTKEEIDKILDKRFVPTLFEKCLIGCGKEAQAHTPRNAAKLAQLQGGVRKTDSVNVLSMRRKTRKYRRTNN